MQNFKLIKLFKKVSMRNKNALTCAIFGLCLGLVACQSDPLVPTRTPSQAGDVALEVKFIDLAKFDHDLYRALHTQDPEIKVVMYEKVSPNNTPDRLQKWLNAVEKNGVLTGEQTLIPLANLANRHGRLVADVIAGREVRAHAAVGTVILGAFGFAVGITGLSECAAIKAGIKHQVIHIHPNSHAGYYPGAHRVSMKVLFDPETGQILGAQANGEDGVDKRIDVIATAMHATAKHGGLTIDDLMDLELAYAPQFGSAKDAINIAGYVGNNVFNGTTPTLQWHQLEAARAAGAQVIDVRSGSEHGNGHIPGTLNIPVEELRDRLAEVQLEDVVVYCQVGQRGHIATQILKAKGAKVRNLDGGYVTWSAGTHSQA